MSTYDELTPDQQAWVRKNERVWERAHSIVQEHPHLDVSGVYHTLIQFERSPEERLRRSLGLGRAAAKARAG